MIGKITELKAIESKEEYDTLLAELTAEAVLMGCLLYKFGPDGSTELLQGATLLPHRHRR